jgi:hypothetical protein
MAKVIEKRERKRLALAGQKLAFEAEQRRIEYDRARNVSWTDVLEQMGRIRDVPTRMEFLELIKQQPSAGDNCGFLMRMVNGYADLENDSEAEFNTYAFRLDSGKSSGDCLISGNRCTVTAKYKVCPNDTCQVHCCRQCIDDVLDHLGLTNKCPFCRTALSVEGNELCEACGGAGLLVVCSQCEKAYAHAGCIGIDEGEIGLNICLCFDCQETK